MCVDVYRAHHDTFVFRYNRCDVRNDADVVVAYDAQCDGVEVLSLSAPSCIHDAVSESFVQFRCVGAVCAVNLYASCDGDESEDVVAVDGPAKLAFVRDAVSLPFL